MKLVHLSDLHLGKRVNEFSMIEDQKFILKQIEEIIDDEKPDGVILAGDIYDKSIPSEEAVNLLDSFIGDLSEKKIPVYAISGNHDSVDRLSFGADIMEKSGIFISRAFNGETKKITLTDQFGEVNLYMLPFVKPSYVKAFYDGEDVSTYTAMCKTIIDKMNIDTSKRNVLIAHQFVANAKISDSEDSMFVGGLCGVDVSVFAPFDYVALGHIHSPQNPGKTPLVRYSGTPLKYSFSEAKDKKSVTILELGKKGDVKYRTVDLKPLRDMVEIKGKYEEIMNKSFYEGKTWNEDYMHITLTDEEDIPNAVAKLRVVYHNLMKIDYDNTRTQRNNAIDVDEKVDTKSPLELFGELYEKQNNQPMSEEQSKFVQSLIEKIWED